MGRRSVRRGTPKGRSRWLRAVLAVSERAWSRTLCRADASCHLTCPNTLLIPGPHDPDRPGVKRSRVQMPTARPSVQIEGQRLRPRRVAQTRGVEFDTNGVERGPVGRSDGRTAHPPQPVATLVARGLRAEPSAMDDTVMPAVRAARHLVLPCQHSHKPGRRWRVQCRSNRAEPGALIAGAPGPTQGCSEGPGIGERGFQGPCAFTPLRTSLLTAGFSQLATARRRREARVSRVAKVGMRRPPDVDPAFLRRSRSSQGRPSLDPRANMLDPNGSAPP